MATVVVVGGGFAGLSAAVRIAKLRHDVTVLESRDQLGGQLRGITHDGLTWQDHAEAVTLPGVFRDLFRKSGRPLDRVLPLTKIAGRRHIFKDRTVLDLPLGNRGDQAQALTAAFGEDKWSAWVDTYADVWDALRRVALDRTFTGRDDFSNAQWKTLRARRPIAKVTLRDITDERLVKLILDPIRMSGDDRRVTPGFLATQHYVERNFGLWLFDGGRPALADALTQRVAERKVTVEFGAHSTGVALENGTVRGVRIGDRTIDADYVIWAAPTWPTPLPEPREMRRIPSARTYLSLDPDTPGLSDDMFIHSNPPIRMWTSGPGQWTVEHRGGEDPILAMARCGLDLRKRIIHRWDQSPVALVTQGHWGWVWQGWSTAASIPGVNPRGGLYFAGAHAHPGTSLELIGMATAAIAEQIGRA